MTDKKTLARMERLEQLTSRLRVDEPTIMRDVAEEFGISLSTLNRDISLLKEKGLPVETEIGRGGGVRISSTWGIGHITLTLKETVDLLVSLASIEKMDIPMTFGNSRSIRTKLISSFSKHDQKRISKIALRIKVGSTSSPQVISTYSPEPSDIVGKMQAAFLLMDAINIDYQDGTGATTQRIVEPHYMILNHPIWYILCWDHLRNDIRTFRIDRVRKIEIIIGVKVVCHTGLGVEKIKCIVNNTRFFPISFVAYSTILKVAINIPLLINLVIGVGKNIEVCLN